MTTTEMIKERIDKLIKTCQKHIDENCIIIEQNKENLIWKLNNGYEGCVQSNAKNINEKRNENKIFEMFIESLEYAKTGERK